MSGCRVFIGHLSPHARERDVEKFFKGYGRIREINLKNGFGFVVSLWELVRYRLCTLSNSLQLKPSQEFDDHRDADDAVYELNGKELCSERYEITASFLFNLVLLALNELCKSKLAVFTCHHHVHRAFQVIYWWQSPEKTGRLHWRNGCNGDFFSGSRLSMLAPDGAEVAAQEWGALVVVVVVVEAIGPLAAVDPGEDMFSLLLWFNFCFLVKHFLRFQIWPSCSHWAQTHCGEPFFANQLAGKVSLLPLKINTPLSFFLRLCYNIHFIIWQSMPHQIMFKNVTPCFSEVHFSCLWAF